MKKSDEKINRLDSINLKRPLVLYGAGIRGRRLLAMILKLGQTNVFVVDKNEECQKKGILGVDVLSPNNIPDTISKNTIFCITIGDFHIAHEVRKELVEKKRIFKPFQEISYDILCLKIYDLFYEKNNVNYESACNSDWNVIFGHYNGLGLGGIESWIKSLVGELKEQCRYNMRIVSCKNEQTLDQKLSNSLDVIVPDDLWQERESVILFQKLLIYLKRKLPCVVITTHADIITKAAVVLKIHNPDQVKIISTIHGGTSNTIRRYMEYDEWTDKVIGCSEDIRKALVDQGVSTDKVFSMTCPFPCEKLMKRQYSVDNTEVIRLGWAGRIEDINRKNQKRLDVLLESLRFLKQKHVRYQMEIAGDGPGLETLKKKIQVLGLDSEVKLIGRLNSIEIGKFWMRQDICVSTSDYEGRSISILEAMGNGAVPVVTNVSGVNEDIITGYNGYIFSCGDYKAIGSGIDYLNRHRELLPVMGQKAHDMVFPKSSLKPHVKFWQKQIEECINA